MRKKVGNSILLMKFRFHRSLWGQMLLGKVYGAQKTIILIPPEGDLTRHITFAVK